METTTKRAVLMIVAIVALVSALPVGRIAGKLPTLLNHKRGKQP
jgi:hypothetical protein